MKIPAHIAKFQLAFTPPFSQEVSSHFFSDRLIGMALPIRLEDLRMKRQRRSIWKKLFIDGVIVPHSVTGAPEIDHHVVRGTQAR